jgi:hypothetical protein
MELNEFLTRLSRNSNPSDYLSRQGFGSRMTRTSGSSLLRDQGYGNQIAIPSYGSLPSAPAVSSGAMPTGNAGIRPNFNRAWAGDMDFPTLSAIGNQAMDRVSRAQKRAKAGSGGYSGRGTGRGGTQQSGSDGATPPLMGVPSGAPSPTRATNYGPSSKKASRAQSRARQAMLDRTQSTMGNQQVGGPGVPSNSFGPKPSFSMEAVNRLEGNAISVDGEYDTRKDDRFDGAGGLRGRNAGPKVSSVAAADADARRAQLAQEFSDLVKNVDAEEGNIASRESSNMEQRVGNVLYDSDEDALAARESFNMEQRVGSQVSDGLADTSKPLRRASEPLRTASEPPSKPLRRASKPLRRDSGPMYDPAPESTPAPFNEPGVWAEGMKDRASGQKFLEKRSGVLGGMPVTAQPLPRASDPLPRKAEPLRRSAEPQWSRDYGTRGEALPTAPPIERTTQPLPKTTQPLRRASQPLRRGVTRTDAPRQTDASRRARQAGAGLNVSARDRIRTDLQDLSQEAQARNAQNM